MRAPRPSSPGRASARLTQSGKIGGHVAQQQSVQILQERLEYEQKLVQLVDRIHSAKGIDNIFIELQGEILELLDADRMTIYAVDTAKKELYSKFLALDTVKEIRLPISEKSIAGYVAASARIVNIADAYDKAELARISPTLSFDGSWDKKTGFRTQQILGMPILHDGKPIGVIQLLNKKRGARFTKEDETGASRIAKTLGIAFNNQAQLIQSQELAQALKNRRIKWAVGLRKDILSFLGQVGGDLSGKDSIGTIIGDLRAEDVGDTLDMSGGELDENDSAVIRLANQIIVDAYKSRASDIH